ncbi:MAG: hypothetical protein ABSB19_01770 [Methylomonas sp.]|jgi:hypothetical protein
MQYSLPAFFLAILALGLQACVGGGAKNPVAEGAKTLQATGYGHFDDNGNVSIHQRWLKAQQAAKLDADRDLAAQLYQENLGEEKTVATQVMKHEAYRQYMDSFLREAHAVDYQTIRSELKASMELKLTPRFYICMAGDMAVINQCIKEDKKLAMTRLGFKQASATSMNINCVNRDCADQFHVQGFSNRPDAVDSVLLDAGLYDKEWMAHTSGSLFSRILLMQVLINGY